MARDVLALSGEQLDAVIANGRFEEVPDYDEAVSAGAHLPGGHGISGRSTH